MHIHIDYNSGEPIIRQVVGQIKLLVVSGKVSAGSKLPSVRGFSKDLKINPTTVTRIYKELEHQGVIVLRQGQGAFVAERKVKLSKKQAREKIKPKVEELLVEGIGAGLSESEIIDVLKQEYNKIKASKNE